jgi:hypothetical protein
VRVFKEGLLSAVGHDLAVAARRFTVELDEQAGRGSARFDARGLGVEHALSGGRPNPGALSPDDVRTIERHIAEDVLEARRYPEVVFAIDSLEREGDSARVRGRLALHGRERPLELLLRRAGERMRGEVRIEQPDFGIKPFRALLGALKIKPHVIVEIDLPAGSS